MKLAMFTPVNQASPIGCLARFLANFLISKGHQLVMVQTEYSAGIDRSIRRSINAKIVFWNDVSQVKNVINQSDMLIYHIGDDYKLHYGCLEWLPQFPGIVCLYDHFLGHLFYDWAQNHCREADELLQHWYNQGHAQDFFSGSHPTQASFIEAFKDFSPMNEWVCSMANAVLAHSHLGIQHVLNSCAGPVNVFEMSNKRRISFADESFLESYVETLTELMAATHRSKPILNAIRHFTGLMATWGATESLMNLPDTLQPLSLFETTDYGKML